MMLFYGVDKNEVFTSGARAGLNGALRKCASGTFLATGVKASIDLREWLAKRSKSRHPHQEKKESAFGSLSFFSACVVMQHILKIDDYIRGS